MSGRKYEMPRRRDFATQEEYERARARRIRQIRRKKRKLRRIVKTVILAVMALLAVSLCLGVFFGVRKLVSVFSGKSVKESILAERYEVMPDLSTIEIENPKESEAPKLNITVCLDPGHGGKDPGSSDPTGTRTEKDDVLDLSLLIRDRLEELGADVIMTRDDDTFLSLSERAYFANQNAATYFISLHRNSVDDSSSAQGVEIYTKVGSDEALEMGGYIMANLEDAGISNNRGVHPGSKTSETSDWQVTRESTMPGCLLELGFISNEEDNRLYDEHLEDYAAAIAQGIVRMVVPEDNVTPKLKGAILKNEKIMDVETLDSTGKTWGPGFQESGSSVPASVLTAQEQYGASQAMFYKENAGKKIFLTFDVGYQTGYTEQILDQLNENEIKGVFFITEPFAQSNPELVQRMIDEGHIVGNHSSLYPEDGMPSLSIEEQKKQVEDLHNYMLKQFNYSMTLFRFPNGRFSEQSLAVVNNLNYASVFWSFAYKDYDEKHQPEAAEAIKAMTDCLHEGAIYLLSANSQTNVSVLQEFAEQVKTTGYEFALLSAASNTENADETESKNTNN